MKMARHFGFGNKGDRERTRMPIIYHHGVDDLRLCPLTHATVTSATACITSAGEYIVAEEDGFFRSLNQAEEAEYQYAIYGANPDRSFAPMEGCRKKRFT